MSKQYTYSPLFRPLCRVGLGLFSSYKIINAENYIEPPYVVTANHMSYADPMLITLSGKYDLVGVAKRQFEGTAVGWLIAGLGAGVFVEQASPDRKALREMLDVLKQGYPLGIGVEGTRSKTGGLLKGFDGAAFIIRKANVPIIPVGITGTQHVWKRPRPKISITIGKPYQLPPQERGNRDIAQDTERIMCAIAALLPEEYHGHYANNPMIDEMRAIVT